MAVKPAVGGGHPVDDRQFSFWLLKENSFLFLDLNGGCFLHDVRSRLPQYLPRPRLLTFTWQRCYGSCQRRKPTELAHSFSFCSCVCFCLMALSTVFHSINCPDDSPFSHCSSGLISASLVLSTLYLFMKVFLSPDIILGGWLGLKHHLTNS